MEVVIMKSRRSVLAGILTLGGIMCAWASFVQNPDLPKVASIELVGGAGMEFVLIGPGTFTMGEETGAAREKPAHKVTLTRPFYLGKYEVTRRQYYAVLRGDASKVDRPDHPVDFARWNDSQEFLSKLNRDRPGIGFRLPTEAEWEYACRAGAGSGYSFGDDPAALPAYAWFGEIVGGSSHPVGQKKPNPWGLYDMHGNAAEWTRSRYRPYPFLEDARDADGNNEPMVVRGGSFHDRPQRCRAGFRLSYPAWQRVHNVGFRVVSTQDRFIPSVGSEREGSW
jgi:formylglycine-generating enzyme required for sulfatase activity